MKKLCLLGGLLSIVILSGCGAAKTSSQPIQFDTYAMRRYTDGKLYQEVSSPVSTTINVVYEAVQQGTGTPNSLIVTKVPITAGAAVEEIIELNASQLQQKLLNYKGITKKKINIRCDDQKNTTGWYMTFSYDLSEDQKFSAFQYFFATGNMLYVISLHSKDAKDIPPMIKSIKTITCR